MAMGAGALQFFDRTPSGLSRETVKKSARSEMSGSGKRALICAACGYIITSDEARTSINGQHAHTRKNPAGFEYTFDCFREAPGCRQTGAPSYEHTWFAGYCWQIAVCSGCGGHLGWLFRNGTVFYGLIEGRFTEKQ